MNTGREKEVVAHAKLVRMIEAKIPDCVALQVHRTKYGDTALRQVLAQYMRCEVHTLEKKVGQYAWSVEGPKRGTGGRGPEGFAKAALLVLNAHSEELSRLHASEQHAASGRSAAEAQSQLDERRARDVSNAAIEQQNAIDRLAFAQREAAQARLADQPLEYLNAALAAQEASRAALANGGDDESEGGDDSGEESDEAGGDEELALEPAAGAGAMHGDDAGGAVEANEGGDQTGGGQCGGDQCGGDQSGADESSGASDEAAGGGTAALRRQLAECKLQLEQVCAEAGCGAPLTLPHTGPYTPYLSSHRRAVCVEVERGAPFTPLTSHAHPLPSAHTLTSPCTPYTPCTPCPFTLE